MGIPGVLCGRFPRSAAACSSGRKSISPAARQLGCRCALSTSRSGLVRIALKALPVAFVGHIKDLLAIMCAIDRWGRGLHLVLRGRERSQLILSDQLRPGACPRRYRYGGRYAISAHLPYLPLHWRASAYLQLRISLTQRPQNHRRGWGTRRCCTHKSPHKDPRRLTPQKDYATRPSQPHSLFRISTS